MSTNLSSEAPASPRLAGSAHEPHGLALVASVEARLCLTSSADEARPESAEATRH